MSTAQQFAANGAEPRRFEYDDRTVIAVDIGPGRGATAEVVDGTVTVATGNEQYDLEVDGATQACINNGVLTVEVDE